MTRDRDLLGKPLEYAINAYRWLRYQDSNNDMLLESQPAAEWRDNTATSHGTVMYINVLYLMATKCIQNLCSVAGIYLSESLHADYNKLKEVF
ncbi:MAG: hypothetical protein QXF01_01075 [Candidatus Micrarchaeaceae archaeon]